MKNERFFVLAIFLLIFLSPGYGQLDDYYNKVKVNPNIVVKVLNDSVELINVYKNQIKLIHENRNLPLTSQQDSFASAMYRDYPILWQSFFGIDKYKKLLNEDWEILNNPDVIGIWLPFSFNIETTFEEIGNKYTKMTGYTPQGKWFLFYGTGRGIGDMGGNEKFMWANFSVIGEKEKFIFNLPHEFNHMVFSKTNKSKTNLLRYIIDEGLACYINENFWGGKYCSSDYIVFNKTDWNWAIENEKKIFQYSKEFLDSEDYDIINKFQSWGESIWEGSPYRLGYFLGYRIIKAYIKKHGKDSLKELYTMDCNLILEKSDYETNFK